MEIFFYKDRLKKGVSRFHFEHIFNSFHTVFSSSFRFFGKKHFLFYGCISTPWLEAISFHAPAYAAVQRKMSQGINSRSLDSSSSTPSPDPNSSIKGSGKRKYLYNKWSKLIRIMSGRNQHRWSQEGEVLSENETNHICNANRYSVHTSMECTLKRCIACNRFLLEYITYAYCILWE